MKGKLVSVVIPAYNEGQSIGEVVGSFVNSELVNEVIVVDNNSKDCTAEFAKNAGARVILEAKQGYGCAIKAGLDAAKGDLLVITEADSSFAAKDIEKFLSYKGDADMVIGTRTVRQLLHAQANMGLFLKWGNVFIAKLIQLLFGPNTYRLTDVGCTYRMISKGAYGKIAGDLREAGPAFAPEMILELIRHDLRFVEIPINYFQRVGASKLSSSKYKSFKIGLSMLRVVFKKRFLKRA